MKTGAQDPGLRLSANCRYSSSIWLYITWSGNGSHTAPCSPVNSLHAIRAPTQLGIDPQEWRQVYE